MPDETEHYTPDEAREEAAKMQEEIKYGRAKDYDEAEANVEKTLEERKQSEISRRDELLVELDPEDKAHKRWLYTIRSGDFDAKRQEEETLSRAYAPILQQFIMEPLTDDEATLRAQITEPLQRVEVGTPQPLSNQKKGESESEEERVTRLEGGGSFVGGITAFRIFEESGWVEAGRFEGGSTFVSPDYKYVAQVIEEGINIDDKSDRLNVNAFNVVVTYYYLDAAVIDERTNDKYASVPPSGFGKNFYITGVRDIEHLRELSQNPQQFADPRTVENYESGKISSQVVIQKKSGQEATETK